MSTVFDKNHFQQERAEIFIGSKDGTMTDVGEVSTLALTPAVTTFDVKGGTSGSTIFQGISSTTLDLTGIFQSVNVYNRARVALSDVLKRPAKTSVTYTLPAMKKGSVAFVDACLTTLELEGLTAGEDYTVNMASGVLIALKPLEATTGTYSTRAAAAIDPLSNPVPDPVRVIIDGTKWGGPVWILEKVLFTPSGALSMNSTGDEIQSLNFSAKALEDSNAVGGGAFGKFGLCVFPDEVPADF